MIEPIKKILREIIVDNPSPQHYYLPEEIIDFACLVMELFKTSPELFQLETIKRRSLFTFYCLALQQEKLSIDGRKKAALCILNNLEVAALCAFKNIEVQEATLYLESGEVQPEIAIDLSLDELDELDEGLPNHNAMKDLIGNIEI